MIRSIIGNLPSKESPIYVHNFSVILKLRYCPAASLARLRSKMFTSEFSAECINNFIALNVVSLVLGTVVECLNPRSIFKPTTRALNKKYWSKRVQEAVKGYVYSMPTFTVGALLTAIWDTHYAEMYCHHAEFDFGRFLLLMILYAILIDSLFYWYHRISHIRTPINLYKHIHQYHHQFNPVTSYSTSATHPIEGMVAISLHFIIAVICSCIFPFDPMSHQIAGFLLTVFNLISHDGTFAADHMTHHDTVNFNHQEFYSGNLSRKDDQKVFSSKTYRVVVRRRRNEKRRQTPESNVTSMGYRIFKIQAILFPYKKGSNSSDITTGKVNR